MLKVKKSISETTEAKRMYQMLKFMLRGLGLFLKMFNKGERENRSPFFCVPVMFSAEGGLVKHCTDNV